MILFSFDVVLKHCWLKGLEYLHLNGIVHGDLRGVSSNVQKLQL